MADPRTCRHQNIHWDDLFKKPKQNKAYCVDCGDDKSVIFSKILQRWYCKKVEEWLINNDLAKELVGHYFFTDFTNFLKKDNNYHTWEKLETAKINDDDEFDDIFGQLTFWEAAKSIEFLCEEFKKEKQNDKPNNQARENKIKQLRQRIKNLTNKPNRTPQEEQELTTKKQELANLEKEYNNSSPNNWLKPTLIIGGIVIITIGVICLLNKKKKK